MQERKPCIGHELTYSPSTVSAGWERVIDFIIIIVIIKAYKISFQTTTTTAEKYLNPNRTPRNNPKKRQSRRTFNNKTTTTSSERGRIFHIRTILRLPPKPTPLRPRYANPPPRAQRPLLHPQTSQNRQITRLRTPRLRKRLCRLWCRRLEVDALRPQGQSAAAAAEKVQVHGHQADRLEMGARSVPLRHRLRPILEDEPRHCRRNTQPGHLPAEERGHGSFLAEAELERGYGG